MVHLVASILAHNVPRAGVRRAQAKERSFEYKNFHLLKIKKRSLSFALYDLSLALARCYGMANF
jgi:hypothetical protein